MIPPWTRGAALTSAALLLAASVDRFLYGAVPRPDLLYPVSAALDAPLALPLALLVAGAGLRAAGRDPWPFALGAGAAVAAAVLLKTGVPAPRPYVTLDAPFPVPESGWPTPYDPDLSSFPSLHATSFFAAAAAARNARRDILVAAVLVASFVAYTRVLLYVHWTLDVAAGAALGWICVAAAERRMRTPDRG